MRASIIWLGIRCCEARRFRIVATAQKAMLPLITKMTFAIRGSSCVSLSSSLGLSMLGFIGSSQTCSYPRCSWRKLYENCSQFQIYCMFVGSQVFDRQQGSATAGSWSRLSVQRCRHQLGESWTEDLGSFGVIIATQIMETAGSCGYKRPLSQLRQTAKASLHSYMTRDIFWNRNCT